MTFVFGEDTAPAAPPTQTRRDTRTIWLESFDGQLQVPFDGAPVKMLRGALGLTKAPEEPIVSRSPGVPGGFLDDVRVLTRQVMLPLQVLAPTQGQAWEAVAKLRAVTRYNRRRSTRDGSCYLMCSSSSGIRRLTVAYVSGLEGEDGGMPNLARFALQLIAVDPYARDREPRSIPFELPDEDEAFLSDDPAHTWDTRALASSTVFGQNMVADIASEAEVHPTIEVVGPFGPGLHIAADSGLSLLVPDGIRTGQTLTVVTEPRAKSIRLDGQIAGGRVARPHRFGEAFVPGPNRMSVVGSGATSASKVRVLWRGGWESMW